MDLSVAERAVPQPAEPMTTLGPWVATMDLPFGSDRDAEIVDRVLGRSSVDVATFNSAV